MWTAIEKILQNGFIALRLEEFSLALQGDSRIRRAPSSEIYLSMGHSVWTALADPLCFPRLRHVSIYLDRNTCHPSTNEDKLQSIVMQQLGVRPKTLLFRATLCRSFNWYNFLQHVSVFF
jgi:hypothetical protein